MSRLIFIKVSALCLVAVSSTSLTVDKSGLLRREVRHRDRDSALQVGSLSAPDDGHETCMHSAFNTDALCHAADPTLAKFNTANENVECAGAICTEAECCEASKCINSEFNDDAKCLEADPLKPKFNLAKADEACAAAICTDTECCEAETPATPIGSASDTPTETGTANQNCMHSAFNDDAKCVEKDPLLPKFNTANAEVACAAAICTEAECCLPANADAIHTPTAQSEDGEKASEDGEKVGEDSEKDGEDGEKNGEDGENDSEDGEQVSEDGAKDGEAGGKDSEDGAKDGGVASNEAAAQSEGGDDDDKDNVVDDDKKEETHVIHNTHDGTATGVMIHWPKSTWQFEEARERALRAPTVPVKPIPAARHAGKVEDGYCSNFEEGSSLHFNGEEASFWKNVNQEECFNKCDLDHACEQAIFRADTQFCVIGNNVMSSKPVELHPDSADQTVDLSGHAKHAHTTCYGKNGFANHYNVAHHVEDGWCSDWLEGFAKNSSAKQCDLAETTQTSQLECSHWGAEYGLSEKGCWAKCNRNEHCTQAVYENKTDSWSCYIGTGTMKSNTGTPGVSRCHDCNNRCLNRMTADVAKAANVAHVPAQKCSASAFSTDAKCAAADPALPKYIASAEDDKTCARPTCDQHECCEAEADVLESNEKCGGSPFNSNAKCAEASNEALPKFNTANIDVACAAAICTEEECCEADTTTAHSEDGEKDGEEDSENGEKHGETDNEKDAETTTANQKCIHSEFNDDAKCLAADANLPKFNLENADVACAAAICTEAECCAADTATAQSEDGEKDGEEDSENGEKHGETDNEKDGETTTANQKCIHSEFNDNAKCLAADANLPKFKLDNADVACAAAICTEAECCEAEAA